MAAADKVKAILNKHGLPCGEITKCGTGFRNEVWFAGDHVVKMYGANSLGYGRELWFYQNAKPPYSPRLIGYGENHIILERIYGAGLFRLWRIMSDMEREAAVEQIAGIACAINKVSLGGAEQYFHIASNWQQYVLARIRNSVKELTNTKGIPPALAKRTLLYTLDHIHCLDDKKLFITYADLHFDNIIITECGRLYLLDYEMLEAAPCDFVLDVWQRMMIHPFIYANEDDHALTLPEDYRHILSWLKKYAPSLFLHPYVRERVNIYGILYELNMLRDYPMGDWPIERIIKYLDGVEW
jgi:hypothetical protein